MDANQEVTIHLENCEQEQSDIPDRRYEIRRKIDKLKREDDDCADRFKKLESIIDTCQRALAYDKLNITHREITIYLKRLEKRLEQKKFDIADRRYEIHREIDELEREDANLADRFNELESIIDKCQRALTGEPISIWAELQRFGL